jgi:ATP/maltotriose-dependent transcriptional regulator MalT
MELLKACFETGPTTVCVKDSNYRVLYQNAASIELCGDQTTQQCQKHCMQCYRKVEDEQEREVGTQHFSNQEIDGAYYDVVLVNDGEHLTTLMVPLSHRHRADLRHFLQYRLTRRELEVISHIIRGESNEVISKKLGISRGTLKCHLNNIYRKVPREELAQWR